MENHYKGISENERYNNDLLNEIRKTNQLLEQLISKIDSGSDKSDTNRQQQARGNSRNPK